MNPMTEPPAATGDDNRTESGRRITVVLIDDHRLLRDGIRRILESQGAFSVIAEAENGTDGIDQVRRNRPDIVLLDVALPGPGVIETVHQLKAVSPQSRIVVLSMYDNGALVSRLLAIGVRGYLLKSISYDELLANLHAVYADPNRLVLSVSQQSLARSGVESKLTTREHQVLVLTAAALSNAQIAARLSLTEATVKRHLRAIFAKLGAVSRIDAVNKAIEAHILSGNERQGWH